MTIVVESNVLKDSRLELGPLFTQFKEKLITIDSDEDVGRDDLDLIICLGGDGTLLYASSLFQVTKEKSVSITRTNLLNCNTQSIKLA